jgi:hypothetical protein
MKNNNRQAQKSCSLLSLYKKAMLSAAFFCCGGVVVELEQKEIREKFSFAQEIIIKMTSLFFRIK